MKKYAKFIAQIIFSVAIMFIALWPLWGTFVLWGILHPSTFFERFAIIALALFFGGAVQFLMILAGLAIVAVVWD